MKVYLLNKNTVDETDTIRFYLIPTIGFGYEKNYYIAISFMFLQYEIMFFKYIYKILSP